MARRKKCKKWVSIMSCLILLIFTGVPSYAASEGIARANEKWIEKTEIPTEVGEIFKLSNGEESGLRRFPHKLNDLQM